MDYRIRWRQRRLERRRQRLLAVPAGLLLGLGLFLALTRLGARPPYWVYQGPLNHTPHFALGTAALYCVWPDGHLETVRLGDGVVQGGGPLFSLPDRFNGTPVYDGHTVYLGSDLGSLWAVLCRTGDALWEYHTTAAIRDEPLLAGERLYFGNDEGNLYCLDLATGQKLWCTNLTFAIPGRVALVGGVLVAATRDGTLHGLEPDTGRVLWRQPLGEPVFSAVTPADPNVVVGTDLGTAFIVAAKTGAVVTSYRTRGLIRSAAAVSDQQVCFGSSDGWLRVVSRDGTARLWAYYVGQPLSVGPCLVGGRYYAGCPGRLVALDAADGRLLRTWQGEEFAGSLAATGDVVYVGTSTGRILALANP